jgi:hypothetical protein
MSNPMNFAVRRSHATQPSSRTAKHDSLLPVMPKRESTETLVWNIAAEVAAEWYRQAVRTPFGKFALWYREARDGERIARPVIAMKSPGSEFSQSIDISGALSTERVTRQVAEAMRTLPILGNG